MVTSCLLYKTVYMYCQKYKYIRDKSVQLHEQQFSKMTQ